MNVDLACHINVCAAGGASGFVMEGLIYAFATESVAARQSTGVEEQQIADAAERVRRRLGLLFLPFRHTCATYVALVILHCRRK